MPRFGKDRHTKVVPPWEKNLQAQIKSGQAVPLICGRVINDLVLGGQADLVKGYADHIKDALQDKYEPSKSASEKGNVPPVYANYIKHLLSAEDDADNLPPLHSDHLLQMTKFKRIIDREMESDAILKSDYLNFIKNRFYDLAEAKGTPEHLLKVVETRFDDLKLSEFPEQLGYPNFEDDHPLMILAGLPFHIYLTTSHHNFIEMALRVAGKEPRVEFCRWHRGLEKSEPSVFETPSILEPDKTYQPNDKEPLVYHLYGYDDYPESLVLTEDDYLCFLIAISQHKGQGADAIPKKIREVMSYSALILLGYELHSWDFRVLFWGLISESIKLSTRDEQVSVSIQVKRSPIEQEYFKQLEGLGFAALPIGRVSGELPPGVDKVDNIFIFNLILSLEQGDGSPNRFVDMTLTDFLSGLTSTDGLQYYYDDTLDPRAQHEDYEESPYVLIIDQFEEIVLSHTEHWRQRAAFFNQLDQAMAGDPLLWVVLTMREDYVTSLEPYAPLLANKLRAHFYMERMGEKAALEAVKEPASRYGRPFAPNVAETLVDDLRQIRADQTAEVFKTSAVSPPASLGQFVEPVQLQVVCYQLWKNLHPETDRQPGSDPEETSAPPLPHSPTPLPSITLADLQEAGDVDTALAEFYEQALQKTLTQSQVSEIELRHWFDRQLITEAGTRGTVYQGPKETAGLSNEAVTALADQFLLRAEMRAGGAWYELVHDRFVEPILQANQRWREQQPLIQVAQAWDDSVRSESHLLEGPPLQEAMDSDWQALGPLVAEFLEAGQAVQQQKEDALRAEKEAHQARELEAAHRLAEEQAARAEEQSQAAAKSRRQAIWLGVVGVIAVIAALVAAWFGIQANKNEDAARQNEATALVAQSAAEADRELAVTTQANTDTAWKLAEAALAEAKTAQRKVARQSRLARAGGLAALSQSVDDPTGSLNLMLAREAVLTTWQADTKLTLSAVITTPFVTWQADTALRQAVTKAEQLPWRMTIPWRKRHTARVFSVAFSPDGKQIVSGSEDQTIRLWMGSTETLLNLAKSLIQRDPPIFSGNERARFGFEGQNRAREH